MYGNLTVQETLDYAAQLRLPHNQFNAAQKAERVQEVMDMLRLEKCRDSKIGDPRTRGISGGERKRTSCGQVSFEVQILVVFCCYVGLKSRV